MTKPSKPISLAPVKSLAKPVADMPPATVKVRQPVVARETVAKSAATVVAETKPVMAAPVPAPVMTTTPKVAIAEAAATQPVVSKPAAIEPVAVPATPAAPKVADKVATMAAVTAPAASVAAAKRAPDTARAKVPVKAMPTAPAMPAPAHAAVVASSMIVAAPVVDAPKPAMLKPAMLKPAMLKPATPKPAVSAPLAAPPAPAFKMPSFGPGMMAAMATQMLSATRAVGEVQAALLDHGVAQLKAGLGDLEACARSTTPSDVVVIQARALRRSADDLTDTIKAVSAKASRAFARG